MEIHVFYYIYEPLPVIINKYYVVNAKYMKFIKMSKYVRRIFSFIKVNNIEFTIHRTRYISDKLHYHLYNYDKEKFMEIYKNYPQYFLNINKEELIKMLYKPVFVKKYLMESEDNDIEDYLT
jgi:hypothetical protein